MEPIDAAEQLILRDYPNCLLAILGGSAGRGEHNEQSDLDIVVIDESVQDLTQRTIGAYGWIIELFFLTKTEYREQFNAGVIAGNPTLQRMVTEGIVIRMSSIGKQVREEAHNDLNMGPLPLTSYDIDVNRYVITELMRDLEGSVRSVEKWFIVQKLTLLLGEFILRANRQWIGEGKALFRLLSNFDSNLAVDVEMSLESFYRYDDQVPLLRLIDKVLEPYGGPHLIGFEE